MKKFLHTTMIPIFTACALLSGILAGGESVIPAAAESAIPAGGEPAILAGAESVIPAGAESAIPAGGEPAIPADGDMLSRLPIWDGPREEPQTETETETEPDAEAESETETEEMTETQPRLPDQEALRQRLLLLRLKYGREFSFAMQIPEAAEREPLRPASILDGLLKFPEYPLPANPKTILDLEKKLTALLESYSGSWSVYVKNLTTGDVFVIHDQPMKSASIMKLFIMASVYDAIEQKKLERTSELVDLLANMISYSSNEAANRLLRSLGDGDLARGVDQVNQYVRRHGYSSMTHEYNGFEDSNTILDHIHFNQISARDCGALLERVYHRTLSSRRVCNEVEDMMLRQQTRYKIPKGLPEGVAVGNKTGEMDTVENDVAIIYAGKSDYILCVLSNDWDSKDAAQRGIQEISSTVYEFFDDEDYYLTDELYRISALPEPEEPAADPADKKPVIAKPYTQKWRNPKYETVGKIMER